ncbi:OmpA family protein [Marinoscillum furvescens]|uniref:WD40 repeat protein n=1 Tax=Marinoscillum furvescens DSM 4134 TaxID=1122208 RepID=A0A3D9KYP4_MARFU|nr:OmpA family protein [Marinoscillum furvescens]RED91503.1 WD40 repeat protein [Marinoscillum furvescens DSM 4134]
MNLHHKLIFIATLMIASISTQAQLSKLFERSLLLGDKKYEAMAYQEAVDNYLKALAREENNVELIEKIADCYNKLNNPVKAEEWYEKVVMLSEIAEVDPINLFHYAEALKANGKYKEAAAWFRAYNAQIDYDDRIASKLQAIENHQILMDDASFINVEKVAFNSEESDFSPVYYSKYIVFVSNRKNKVFESTYSWDGSNYLDTYFVLLNSPTTSEYEPVPFDATINTAMHDGPICFYKFYSKAVFTRNSLYKGKHKRSKENTSHLQIYFTEKVSPSDWGNITPFEHNDPEYSMGHAYITNDGSTMVFASNMPGTYGKSDLFISKNIGGSWTKPENLGDHINTQGDEFFPYIEDSVLYFSSNGHGGLGGLDIFHVDLRNPSEVHNAGAPFNSSLDDFGYVRRHKEGYFSSNRGGNDDIYYFKDTRPDYIQVAGTVLNEWTDQPIPYAVTTIGQDTITADAEGKFTAQIIPDSAYLYTASSANHILRETITRSFPLTEKNAEVDLWMRPLKAHITVVDAVTDEVLNNAPIKLRDLTNGEDIEPYYITDQEYIFPIKNGVMYELTGAMDDYFTSRTIETPENVADAINWKIPLDKIVLHQEITLENIYYDLNKATIRSDAKIELDDLAFMLKEQPSIHIELSSHTDSRGDDAYNMELSQRRAEAVVTYLAEQGIAPERLNAKGYGETKLKNECGNGVECPEWAHQYNRRTELKVTKYEMRAVSVN